MKEARQNEEMSSDCVYVKFKHRKRESKVLEAQGAPGAEVGGPVSEGVPGLLGCDSRPRAVRSPR